MSGVIIFLLVTGVILLVGIIAMFIYMLRARAKKIAELWKRLPDVAYTEIVSSSTGASGSINTYNTKGELSFGSFYSSPSTKFLIVYKSGEKQIVNLGDGTALFNEYVQLLRK